MKNRENICIVAGMPRAATTFLYHTLEHHPSAYIPVRKETDYFSVNYYRGEKWYLNFFKDLQEHQIGFDISPMYFLDNKAPSRIQMFNPNAKLILIIRDPVEWIISFYKHMQAKTFMEMNLLKFIEKYVYKKDGKKLPLSFPSKIFEINILNFQKRFDKSLLLCDFSIMRESPLLLLKALEKFTGLSEFYNETNFEDRIINASNQEPSRIVNILMQNKLFADTVVKLIPKKLILKIRQDLQSSPKKDKVNQRKSIIDEEKIDYLKNLYSADQKYISTLFRNTSFILGNGNTLEVSK